MSQTLKFCHLLAFCLLKLAGSKIVSVAIWASLVKFSFGIFACCLESS